MLCGTLLARFLISCFSHKRRHMADPKPLVHLFIGQNPPPPKKKRNSSVTQDNSLATFFHTAGAPSHA